MPRCLNPKKAHENPVSLARPVLSGSTVALSEMDTHKNSEIGEAQVGCQFCKYLLEGALLGDCRALRWIGSGAFGDVYEAQQLPPVNRRVAIKVMSIERVVDGQSAEMFAHEVSTIAALDHPHILPVLRAGIIEDGRSYLVMKFAAQGSLQHYCQPTGAVVSFLPTLSPADLGEAPGDSLVIATAETQEIVDLIDEGEAEVHAQNASLDRATPEALAEHDSTSLHDYKKFAGNGSKNGTASAPEHTHNAQAPNSQHASAAKNGTNGVAHAQQAKNGAQAAELIDTVQLEEGQQPVTPLPTNIEQADTLPLADAGKPGAATTPRVSGEVNLLSPQKALRYLEEAASALQYAHEHSLIHLDVKPANLLLDAQERVMLADFGVSVLLDGYTHASLHYYVGTPLYTAPEQWLEQPRAASDQYALAVTFYQLLTGRAPFTGNLYAVMHGHLQSPPPPLREFNPLLPAQLEPVFQRALAKDPTRRYPDVLAFAHAYREALESVAHTPTGAGTEQRTPAPPQKMEQQVSQRPSQGNAPLVLPANNQVKPAPVGPLDRYDASREDTEPPGAWSPPPRRQHRARNVLLVLLALLLVAGGGLGLVRVEQPCWLGVCARITLSSTTVNFTNNGKPQPITMTNTGATDLNWVAEWSTPHSWPTVYPTTGKLAPGKTAMLTITANVGSLAKGDYNDRLTINGGAGVVAQTIAVTEHVAVDDGIYVDTSLVPFQYAHNHLQPATQTIKLTNHNGHTFTWGALLSTDNNWLVVAPGSGTLLNDQSVDLTLSAPTVQSLPSKTYTVRFSIQGAFDNHTIYSMQPLTLTLQVQQQPAITPTATPTSPLTFSMQQLTSSGAPGQGRSLHSMVWDPQNNTVLVFGGVNSQGLHNDLWSYNPNSGQWTQLTPSTNATSTDCSGSSPAPRASAAMVWDSIDNEVLIYGGIGANHTFLSDLWAYSPNAGTWTLLSCTNSASNTPGPRSGAGVAWNGNQMLLLGGHNSDNSSGLLDDFWSYTPGPAGAKGSWSQLQNSPLGALVYPTMSWDSRDRALYVFGGTTATAQSNTIATYQPSNGGWHIATPSNAPGTGPMARQLALSAWDSKDNVFLMTGGWSATDKTTTLNSLWSYSPDQNIWWQNSEPQIAKSSGGFPGRSASIMVWDSSTNSAYLYAGVGSPDTTIVLNDLWVIHAG